MISQQVHTLYSLVMQTRQCIPDLALSLRNLDVLLLGCKSETDHLAIAVAMIFVSLEGRDMVCA